MTLQKDTKGKAKEAAESNMVLEEEDVRTEAQPVKLAAEGVDDEENNNNIEVAAQETVKKSKEKS